MGYRITIILIYLLALLGCSRQPPTEHHILPNGFSGVYRIMGSSQHLGGYTKEASRYVFTIPEEGVLQVDASVFEGQCLSCNGLSAEFANGQAIPLYSPVAPPPAATADIPMLLGVLGSGKDIWYAVGTHEQLTRLLEQLRENNYKNLEELLPPLERAQ